MLLIDMARSYKIFILIIFIAAIVIFVGLFLAQPDPALSKLGPFVIGKEMPLHFRPGAGTVWAPPYEKIPYSKFYVFIAKNNSCIWESCGMDGAVVQTLGGYLAGESLSQPVIAEEFGFDNEEIRKRYKSVIIIGDQNAKIVGIYPNRGISNVLSILRLHPKIADFSLLNGVNEAGPLKIGELAPVAPYGGQISEGKNFYVYAFSQNILAKGPCVSVACLGPGYFDYADEFGGWFASDGKLETVKAFGLDVDKLARGEVSLVVVTDKNLRIAAIHPGKIASDILTILRQHPELADLSRF